MSHIQNELKLSKTGKELRIDFNYIKKNNIFVSKHFFHWPSPRISKKTSCFSRRSLETRSERRWRMGRRTWRQEAAGGCPHLNSFPQGVVASVGG